MKYMGGKIQSDVSKRNIEVHFVNNSIYRYNESRGQVLFLFSAKPCNRIYQGVENSDNFTKTLSKIANFHFEGGGVDNHTFGTYPSNFTLEIPKYLIPGIKTQLSLNATDDMKSTVGNPILRIGIAYPQESPDIKLMNNIIQANDGLTIHGRPESKAILKLKLLQGMAGILYFRVRLDNCPPGFFLNDNNSCECYAERRAYYLGIETCNSTLHQAELSSRFWGGYINGTKEFRTSYCPYGYCNKQNQNVLLPPRALEDELNDAVCAENRRGKVCAECIENTSVFYHTQNHFNCSRNTELCHLGILFYTLSQIFPVTLLFVTIVLFDIQLTTGALNGFLLYMQILNVLLTKENMPLRQSNKIQVPFDSLSGIGMTFDLIFFSFPSLSFCLFEKINSLQLIFFDYTTIAYSLVLVILTALFMSPRCTKIHKQLQKFGGKKYLFSRSIVHGLAGFLVLCYSRTTSLSLKILTPTILYSNRTKEEETAVFYYGEYRYFGKEHSRYAIPSLFVLIFMIILPPLLLLTYPLCYKLLAFFKLEESTFAKALCTIVPLDKLKPFFDSIQSAFKDKHRYFAGLYFLYRLLPPLFYVTTKTMAGFYTFLELQFLAMIALHAWVQPYREKWHNRLDLCFFTILAVFNGITMYIYHLRYTPYYDGNNEALAIVQVLLAYTPLCYIIIYIIVKLKNKVQTIKCLTRKAQKENEIEQSLSTLDQNLLEEVDYQSLTNNRR